jgi:hypothetical protein
MALFSITVEMTSSADFWVESDSLDTAKTVARELAENEPDMWVEDLFDVWASPASAAPTTPHTLIFVDTGDMKGEWVSGPTYAKLLEWQSVVSDNSRLNLQTETLPGLESVA